MKVTYETLKCKFCGSTHVVRFGRYKTSQKWLCRDCKKHFTDNDALPGMKMPANQVADALDLYYKGTSLNAICDHLNQQYHDNPSNAAIYAWLERFTKKGIRESEPYKLGGDKEWICDETVIRISGKKWWVIDVMGADSRVLLASHLSFNRSIRDIKKALEEAHERSGTTPTQILTDGWGAYPDSVEQVFGADSTHVQSTPFTNKDLSTNKIERLQGSLKDRYKVMRGLKKRESTEQFLDGWRFYYNYLRVHDTLGKTPAEATGQKYPFKNWADIVQTGLPKDYPKITTHVVETEIPARNTYSDLDNSRFRTIRSTSRITPRTPRLTPPRPRISRSIDLGGGIVRDRRGQHLRLN